MRARPRVVVAGAGFAGLEAAFLLRMRLREEVEIDLIAPDEHFVFRPNTVYLPFGGDVDSLVVDTDRAMHRRDIHRHVGRLRDVDPAARTVTLEDGDRLHYDFLVVATGAAMRPGEVPGLAEHAATIWTIPEMLDTGRRLAAVRDRAAAGERQRVVLAVPVDNRCAGPMYELAFMIETWLRRQGVRERVDLAFRTFERSYIQAFGPRLHEVVAGEFAERGIDGRTGAGPVAIRAGEADFAGEGEGRATEPHDLMIAFPPHVSAVGYPGLPSDERGFLLTDPDTRQVEGHPQVFAPGDAGDFPVKQAFLAFLQADAAAEHIASQVRGTEFAAPFDPVAMCIMEMFDKATFAQVPLRVTGDPARPVEVRPDAGDDYKVGVSALWRLGKKMLGVYLPMRFHSGEPFHAGKGWQMMEVGLKGMKGVMAD